jgi:NRPS condensation-like uncharacterized protein
MARMPAPTQQRAPGFSWPAAPFTVADELSSYYDTPAEPNNVHVEVRLAGHLGEAALRRAAHDVLTARPRARARLVPGRRWRRPAWEYPQQPDAAVLMRADWSDERELGQLREQFLAEAPPLRSSPPLRLLLAAGPQQDCVILKAHHAALDGLSCLHLLQDVALSYRGQPVAPEPERAGSLDAAGTESARPSKPAAPASESATSPAPRSGRRRPGLMWPAVRLPRRAARIASEQAATRSPGGSAAASSAAALPPGHAVPPLPAAPCTTAGGQRRAGYGVVLVRTEVPEPAAWPGATVNDVLITALILAISRWNAVRGRTRGLIRITVPIDARPPGSADATGNLSRLSAITAEPAATGADVADLIDNVTSQTRLAKEHQGPQVSAMHRALAAIPAPAFAKKWLVRAGLRLAGPLICDTSLLSNLGRVTDPPDFGAPAPAGLWFSTSAHMPRGLSVGAVTVGGRLHLSFRYRRALFDHAAAAQFAACYQAALAELRAHGRHGPVS